MSKLSSKVNMTFVYTNASDSAKPVYLSRKFANERKRLAEEAAKREAEAAAISVEQAVKVHVLKGQK